MPVNLFPCYLYMCPSKLHACQSISLLSLHVSFQVPCLSIYFPAIFTCVLPSSMPVNLFPCYLYMCPSKFHACQSIFLLSLHMSFQVLQIIMQTFCRVSKLKFFLWRNFIYDSSKCFVFHLIRNSSLISISDCY